MRSIAHISDPHFGSEDLRLVDALLAELDGRSAPVPTLVAVSGDLTQRARPRQFEAARRFLDRLPCPHLAVPGNHDVPRALVERLVRPLARYRRYIGADLSPVYFDAELAVVGVDTAHGWTLKRGRITHAQMSNACARLGASGAEWRLLVAHHPFVVPFRGSKKDVVGGAAAALAQLDACGLDVVLSGHLHRPFIGGDAAGFRDDEHRIVQVHAGTCISTRLRGEANGYNRLELDGAILTTVHRVWDGRRFVDGASKAYERCLGPGGQRRFVKIRFRPVVR